MNNVITVRDIDTVTTEIKVIQSQTQRVCMLSAIRIGGCLVEAKEMLPHGEWGAWLAKSVQYSQSTAENLIRLYKEYGDKDQDSLFGNPEKSQAFANLSYTQALALLAVPADEREQFAAENDVAEMSTRELQQAIKDRNAAIAERDAAKQDRANAQQEAENLKKDARKLEAAAISAQKDAKKAREYVLKLEKNMEEATTAVKTAQAELEEAKAHPEIPQSVMDQMRAEVAEQAAKDATEEIQKKLDAANRVAEEAEKAKQEAEAALEAAQKEAKLQSPEVAVFGALFKQLQTDLNTLNAHRTKTAATNPEAAESMRKAMQALCQQALASLEDASE